MNRAYNGPRHLRADNEPAANVIRPVDRMSEETTARLVLQFHLIDTSTGRCLRCGEYGPCSARLAAMRVVEPNERQMPEPPPEPEPLSGELASEHPEIKTYNGRIYRRVA